MLDSRHQRYFVVINRYHKFPADQRRAALDGLIKTIMLTDDDPFTRNMVGKFYQKEAARLGQQQNAAP